MTPNDKAKELLFKYSKFVDGWTTMNKPGEKMGVAWEGTLMKLGRMKQCASMAVDEVLYALSVPPIKNEGHKLYDSQIDYWNQVKQEIEKL